jgi:hypothetical protein
MRALIASAFIITGIVGGVACMAACGASSNANGGGSLDGGDNDGGGTLDVGGGGDTGLNGDVSNDTTAPAEAYVYGHSADTLYRLDTKALNVTMIGPFTDTAGGAPITDMTDIALDKDGTMYGVTFGDLYRIDYKSGGVRCTHLATLSTEFNGLTFVPAGTIDPAAEVLVGVALDGGWWRVDVTSGATSAKLTQLGSYGGSIGSSGDTVGIIGDQVYATVTGLGTDDHVIVVDPKTGAMTKDLGGTGVNGFWGVGYWGGVMYGFTSDGSLYSIDLKTAKTTKIPITNAPSGGWWGAGVTTSAPTTIH